MEKGTANIVYFVCSGNTCRSPMAEGLLKHALRAESSQLSNIQVQSFGTSAFPGCRASDNSVFALDKVGIDIKNHQSQSLDQIDFETGIVFLCMTQAHLQTLLGYTDVDPSKVFLVREWLETPPQDIPDPFGLSVDAYTQCRDAIVEAIPSITKYLKSQTS